MNLLREYIRELLKEKGELGKQVFALNLPLKVLVTPEMSRILS